MTLTYVRFNTLTHGLGSLCWTTIDVKLSSHYRDSMSEIQMIDIGREFKAKQRKIQTVNRY